MDAFLSTAPEDVARLRSGHAVTATRYAASTSSISDPTTDTTANAVQPSNSTSCQTNSPESKKKRDYTLSLRYLKSVQRDFPWLAVPIPKTPGMTLYQTEGRVLCNVCGETLKPSKRQHLESHHETAHVVHQDIASAFPSDAMLDRALYSTVSLRMGGVLPNGFDTLRSVGYTSISGASADSVPERHLVSSLIAKFNIKLRTRIIDQLADSPLVLVIDESTSGLDSMREKPGLCSTSGQL